MTVSIVLYLLATSTAVSAAAWIADEGLRRAGLPSRWLWPVALALPLVLLVAPWMLSILGGTTMGLGAPGGFVFELPELLLEKGDGGLVSLHRAVQGLWLLSTLGMAGVLLHAHRRLDRARRTWEVREVHGRPVYVSSDLGPAIAGILRPWIVLPRWTLTLPEAELGFVVLHEEEHLRGRDSTLLAVSIGLAALTPWNPVTWWSLRRLKSSMEVDCDRRVLGRRPDRRRYGSSLLTVAARAAGPSLGMASFAERPRSLERRILVMTTRRTRWAPVHALGLIALALLVGLQACGVESPVSEGEAESFRAVELPPPATDQVGVENVEFTPFTVAPSILNRDEIVAAMDAGYPPLLRDAGIGGTVRVWAFVNTDGRVEDTRIDESSGHQALDQAALGVLGSFRFSPALNEDEPVPAWIALPITFQVR